MSRGSRSELPRFKIVASLRNTPHALYISCHEFASELTEASAKISIRLLKPLAMEFPTFDNVQTTLQDIQRYIEQNILRLPTRRAMRLLIIISAYYLLRPWLVKLAGLNAGMESTKIRPEDKDSPAATEAPTASKAAILVSEGIESEDEEDGEQMARRRQRPLQEILEGKNRPRAESEAESDKEFVEFLRKVVK